MVCDICEQKKKDGLRQQVALAVYDAKLPGGRWAYVCQFHFTLYGCSLGLGKGSKL